MRVLALSNFPYQAAATRFRVGQFVDPLRERGIELDLKPFLDAKHFQSLYSAGGRIRKAAGLLPSVLSRFGDAFSSPQYDVVFVQREAMFLGPAFFEWLIRRAGGLPMVLDLDDATYVPYKSPSYGRLGSAFKFFGKTDKLIDAAAVVTCGNRFIAEYVEARGSRAVVIPTIVDTKVFRPSDAENEIPVIGWIGTHSTFPSVAFLFPVFKKLADKHHFKLKLVGTGQRTVEIPGVVVENLDWSLEREVEDFRSLDIGLYPIVTSPSASELWLKGKSGFKAIEYLAVGVPFVMSPVGVCAEIGVDRVTHFNAETPEDWYTALNALLSDAAFRREMGGQGRKHSLETYTVERWSGVLANVLLSCGKRTEER